MEQTIKQRQEIDARWQWATTDLFATDEAWEAAYAQCEAQLPALAARPIRPAATAKRGWVAPTPR